MSNRLKRTLEAKRQKAVSEKLVGAKTAEQKSVKVWQVPVVLNRDNGKVIGLLTLDPDKVPKGTDWGLQPGIDAKGDIIAFSTVIKGQHSSLTK